MIAVDPSKGTYRAEALHAVGRALVRAVPSAPKREGDLLLTRAALLAAIARRPDAEIVLARLFCLAIHNPRLRPLLNLA